MAVSGSDDRHTMDVHCYYLGQTRIGIVKPNGYGMADILMTTDIVIDIQHRWV